MQPAAGRFAAKGETVRELLIGESTRLTEAHDCAIHSISNHPRKPSTVCAVCPQTLVT
jgi:hypothetical protein